MVHLCSVVYSLSRVSIISGQDHSAYKTRFGSLIRAYELIGYKPDRDYRYIEINQRLRRMYPEIVMSTVNRIQDLGGTVQTEENGGRVLPGHAIPARDVPCVLSKLS